MFSLLDKLNDLRNQFLGSRADNQDVAEIEGWIDSAKRLFILKSLKDHDGIKYVLAIFQSEIESINNQLLKADSKILSDYQRDRLLDKRELAQKYLDLFIPVEGRLEDLEKKVDDNY